MKTILLFFAFSLNTFFFYATNYYVANNGNDNNNGEINTPFESITKAQEVANEGDTVYIRGGVYNMREDQIAEYDGIFAYVTRLNKNGISYVAYQNEQPVFDYSNVKPAEKRVIAFYLTGDNIHIKGIEVVGVQVTIKEHTQSECFHIEGNNNTIEQVKMHDGMAIGVYIVKGDGNLILNCDAYNNWDSVSEGGVGGNTDGFGCHTSHSKGTNVFRGCRAWYNSDDGFDLINNSSTVVFDHCWAFYNGYSSDGGSRGDGNGFKAGGYAAGAVPYNTILAKYAPIPRHTIKFCIAVGNKQSGFYANHHLEGNYWYNNSAYGNKRNYNMLNCKALNPSDYGTDAPGWNHVMANNLGFAARLTPAPSGEIVNIDESRCTLNNNSFGQNATVTVDESDFLSIDESLLMAPRKTDGSLPDIDFLKLAPSSDLIDAGYDIGFPYNDSAPDLGYSESIGSLSTKNYPVDKEEKGLFNYPNPFSSETNIAFNLKQPSKIELLIYDLKGKKIRDISPKIYPKGKNSFVLNSNGLSSGNYLLVLKGINQQLKSKLITVK